MEIDVQFWRDGVSTPLLGMVATWIDTNVPVSVKSHSAGDASYFVDVLCAS